MADGFQIETRNMAGGILDAQVAELLQLMEKMDSPPFESLSPEEARKAIGDRVYEIGGEKIALGKVEDRTIPGPGGDLPIRVFTPEGKGPFPALLYFHGGGWVTCNTETYDPACRQVCNLSNCIVVSLDYRLAPEHKFPAANEDAMAALQWLEQNGSEIGVDAGRIAVGGDSAGGQMAAVLALRCRDEGGPSIALQLLIYPVTDLTRMDTESYQQYSDGCFLTKGMMEWFRGHYLNSLSDAQSPHASPLLAEDLSGLPPAYILTAEFDPLRDEGEAYAKKLDDAGTPVRCVRYNGLIHPFWSLGGVIDATHEAYRETADALKKAFY